MYSLRSGARRQASIPFPQRKRRQEDCLKAPGTDEREEASPTKSPRRGERTDHSWGDDRLAFCLCDPHSRLLFSTSAILLSDKPLTRSAARRGAKARVAVPRSENSPPSSPATKLAPLLTVDARSPLRESNTCLPAAATPEASRRGAKEFTPTPPQGNAKSKTKAEGSSHLGRD